MSRRTSRSTSFTSGVNPVGPFRAKVVGVSGGLASIKIPRLGLNNVYEDVPYSGFVPSVGTDVWAFFIEGDASRPMIIVSAEDSQSDINEIVAGTNLNGGGTGGSITLNLDDDITLSTVTADGFYGDLYGAIHILVKNVSGGSLTKGTPVYATGAVGASGAVEVEASLAGTGSTMPAMGLLDQDLANNGEGDVVVSGVLQHIDTDTPGYSVGDELYVAASGGLTTTRPTGSSELVQKIGKVIRVQQNTGEILVQGAGRTNDVPNSFTTSGDVTVGGDLTVNGTTVTLNTETLTVEDNIILLNSNVSGTPSLDAGIEVERGSSSNVSFLWDESADAWTIGAVDFVVDTNTLFVDASTDRVGIGTTSPDSVLEVSDGTEAKIILDDTGGTVGAATNSHVEFQAGGSEAGYVGFSNVGDGTMRLRNENGILILETLTDDNLSLRTNNTTRLTVTGTGSVGIGTTPDAKFHVDGGTSDTNIRVTSSDAGAYIGFDDSTTTGDWWRQRVGVQGNSLVFQTNGATRMDISSSGTVSVGGSRVLTTADEGSGNGLDADTLDGSHASSFITTSTTQPNDIYIRQTSPTVYFRDTDHRSAMIHVNSDIFYILRGSGDDSTSWAQHNSHWPMQINLNDNNVTFGGDIYMRAVNANRPYINRVGGIFFTWDSDTYGTNTHHSIRSTDGDSWTDCITINSFGNIRMNFDSNSNGTNTFTIGHQTTGTANTLFTLSEAGDITLYGYLHAATNNQDEVFRVGDDAWIGDTDASHTLSIFSTSSDTQGKIQFCKATGPTIGAQDTTYFRMYSQVVASGLATTTGNNTIRYNSSSVLLKFTSLREKKQDITPITGVLDYLNEKSPLYNLEPVMFHERDQEIDGQTFNSGRGEWVLGFIAEDVHEVAPELTSMDEDGALSSVSLESMVPLLVAEIQRLGGLVEELYSNANPDWDAPTPRPDTRGDAEKAVFDAAALAIAVETEAERVRLAEADAAAMAYREAQQAERAAAQEAALAADSEATAAEAEE
jgi:hypothetical protein